MLNKQLKSLAGITQVCQDVAQIPFAINLTAQRGQLAKRVTLEKV